MLSAPDIAILGAVALLVFGPDQLPKIARKVGSVMRDVQNTSQQFIREMERAADEHDENERPHLEAVPSVYDQAGEPEVHEGEPNEPMLPGMEPEIKPKSEPVEF